MGAAAHGRRALDGAAARRPARGLRARAEYPGRIRTVTVPTAGQAERRRGRLRQLEVAALHVGPAVVDPHGHGLGAVGDAQHRPEAQGAVGGAERRGVVGLAAGQARAVKPAPYQPATAVNVGTAAADRRAAGRGRRPRGRARRGSGAVRPGAGSAVHRLAARGVHGGVAGQARSASRSGTRPRSLGLGWRAGRRRCRSRSRPPRRPPGRRRAAPRRVPPRRPPAAASSRRSAAAGRHGDRRAAAPRGRAARATRSSFADREPPLGDAQAGRGGAVAGDDGAVAAPERLEQVEPRLDVAEVRAGEDLDDGARLGGHVERDESLLQAPAGGVVVVPDAVEARPPARQRRLLGVELRAERGVLGVQLVLARSRSSSAVGAATAVPAVQHAASQRGDAATAGQSAGDRTRACAEASPPVSVARRPGLDRRAPPGRRAEWDTPARSGSRAPGGR